MRHLCSTQESIAQIVEKLAEKNSVKTLGLTRGTLETHLIRALSKLSNLTTLKLMALKSVNGNALENLLSVLQLKHLHIIGCADTQYEDIAAGV